MDFADIESSAREVCEIYFEKPEAKCIEEMHQNAWVQRKLGYNLIKI